MSIIYCIISMYILVMLYISEARDVLFVKNKIVETLYKVNVNARRNGIFFVNKNIFLCQIREKTFCIKLR